jgi:hypothetical protein
LATATDARRAEAICKVALVSPLEVQRLGEVADVVRKSTQLNTFREKTYGGITMITALIKNVTFKRATPHRNACSLTNNGTAETDVSALPVAIG